VEHTTFAITKLNWKQVGMILTDEFRLTVCNAIHVWKIFTVSHPDGLRRHNQNFWMSETCFVSRAACLWGDLHVLPVYAWVLSGFSGVLTPSKNLHVKLIGDCKLSLRVNVDAWMPGCLFVSFVSVWPCDGLATCPGWTPPLAQWQLG